jgi:hypothetical protein
MAVFAAIGSPNGFAVFQISTYIALVLTAAVIATLPSSAIAAAVAINFSAYSSLLALQLLAYSASGFEPAQLDIAYGFSNYLFFNHMQTIFIPLFTG